MRSQSSCAVQPFALVCLHAQTAVHAGIYMYTHAPDEPQFSLQKTRRPPNLAQFWVQDGAGFGDK